MDESNESILIENEEKSEKNEEKVSEMVEESEKIASNEENPAKLEEFSENIEENSSDLSGENEENSLEDNVNENIEVNSSKSEEKLNDDDDFEVKKEEIEESGKEIDQIDEKEENEESKDDFNEIPVENGTESVDFDEKDEEKSKDLIEKEEKLEENELKFEKSTEFDDFGSDNANFVEKTERNEDFGGEKADFPSFEAKFDDFDDKSKGFEADFSSFDAKFDDFEEKNGDFGGKDANFSSFDAKFDDFGDFEGNDNDNNAKDDDFSFGDDDDFENFGKDSQIQSQNPPSTQIKSTPSLFSLDESSILSNVNNILNSSQLSSFSFLSESTDLNEDSAKESNLESLVSKSELFQNVTKPKEKRKGPYESEVLNARAYFSSLNKTCPSIKKELMETILDLTHSNEKFTFSSSILNLDESFELESLPNDLESLEEEEREAIKMTRDWIAKKILSDEENFCKKVEKTVEKYEEKLGGGAFISKENLDFLFGNLKEILGFHSKLVEDLRKRLKDWNDSQCLSDLFISRAEELERIYGNYSSKFVQVVDEVEKNESESNELVELLKELNEGSNSFRLELVEPMKEIPRFISHLEELRRHSWINHPDLENMCKALEELNRIANSTISQVINKVRFISYSMRQRKYTR
eukprot:TRINITY_DN2767_c0_g1_i5.p1 TRINITY_DN2767_c0_g1~~TRINITY_DN2767_c0_g1_i5.p1  ORF type:complete len:653 (+),score=289.68 TRINITY_DN2767_c0_g1_i5:41-1960(+)